MNTEAGKGAPARTVLVVEDEALVREVLCDDLREAGYLVDEAERGDDAIAALQRGFDVLLTDIRLPGRLTGWDVAEAARRATPDIQVIYMTGYTPDAPRQVAGSQLISKPCTGSEIVALMQRSAA
ncbi:MAG: response regulator [Proteobacteria bacterium]|nr:response regulator [Pseudomonadota bacterium]